ncbi:MAG: peptide ABC transporter ATP-binding protein [Spirochaetes bacterium]|nr:MAG: peptide ABC transporter ATP-binding protein [Spirochaetota bacterium]
MTDKSEDKLIRVESLVKHFPVPGKRKAVVHAVDNVSFSIRKGETLGLVGESGCGKSTVAKSIIRMHKLTSGSIFLGDDDIAGLSEKELRPYRKRMQMVFQDPYSSLNPRMTVLKLVAEPMIAQGVVSSSKQGRELIVGMLNKVGLSAEHTSRYPHEFSGGQRQRISLARALILEPEFIICDEPISALDVSIQAQVINLLQKFKQEQSLTYLFIAHDLSMVRYVSDHVGVMYLGKMMELCDSEQIYKEPLHPYTQGLLAAIPAPDPALAVKKSTTAIEGDLPSPITPPPGCRFHTRCSQCMTICREEEPELKDVGGGHLVACHLMD